MNYLKSYKFFITPAVTTLCTIAIVFLQLPKLSLQNQQLDKSEYVRQEEIEKIRLIFLDKIPSFGFNNLTSAWSFINFIQYFGDSKAREKTGYSLSPEYFESVVNHNPRLVNAYFSLSSATSLFAGRPERSVALIERGLQSIAPTTDPKAYLLWVYKGIDELLFLNNPQAARHSYEMAAQWAYFSLDKNSKQIAANAKATAQFLAKNPGSVQVRIGAWATILSNAPDDATRQIAIRNIQKLGGEIIVTPNGSLQIKSLTGK